MKFMHRHTEAHRSDRIGWLRAAVLGANDGIVSTASLLIGVAAANASHATLLVTGMAGLMAGAMSMAAGEYISVHSQADTERPICPANGQNWRATRKPNTSNSPTSTCIAAYHPNWRIKWPIN